MKCPRKFGKLPFEGGEGCDGECAVRFRNGDKAVCGIAAYIANELERSGRMFTINWEMEEPREGCGE